MAAGSLIFACPSWFWALSAVPFLAAGLWIASKKTARRRVARFFSPAQAMAVLKTLDWTKKKAGFAAVSLVLVLFALALARPLTGPKTDQGERKGADLVILLDVSKSMWVEDVKPNRMEAAKKSLNDWIQKQKSDRIGLVLFAGEAFVQAPLTYDYNALGFVLQDAGPGSVSKKGSNLPKAVEVAAQMLNNNQVESKILLIVSDGESEGDAITAARTARQRDGITLFTVGIGTSAGGKVPTFDKKKTDKPPMNTPPFARNEFGGEVISRLESQTLRAIASVGGGAYYEWKEGEPTFELMREKSLMPLVEKNRKIDAKDYDEWFQIPLLLAVLILFLEPLLYLRRKKETKKQTGVPVVRPTTYSRRPKTRPQTGALVSCLLACFVLLQNPEARAREAYMDKTDQLLASGKKEEAVAHMRQLAEKNPTDAVLSYNLGMTLLRAGLGEESRPVFESVQVLSSNPDLRALCAFQLGTLSLQEAIRLKGDQHSGLARVRALENALSYFETQEDLDSSKEGRNNLKLAEGELETVLLAIGKERTRANTEKTLREALQAYERVVELDKEHQPLVDKAKELLAAKLAESAGTLDREADAGEAKESSSGKDGQKSLQGLFDKRQEALGKLQEANGHSPKDKGIQEAMAKQQEKMSALLTRMAKQQADPLLEKKQNFYSNNNLEALRNASSQLDQALTLDPGNSEAKDLSEKVKDSLIDAHLTNGELALKHFRKSTESEGKLEKAQSAVKEFSTVLALDPENKRAKEGLAEVEPALADLHAEVGMNELETAQQQLGNTPPSSPAPETPGSPASPSDPAQTAGNNPASGASESDLRKSSATLEKALQNLGAAVTMKPQDPKHQQALKDAETLMGNVRDQLAKLEAAKGGKGEEQGKGSGEGKEGQGEGPGGDPQNGAGGSMLSMSGLRGKAGAGGAEGGDTRRYWEKYVRDW